MTNPGIPEQVRRLVVDSLDSVAEMEALLLLRREPRTVWTVDELASRLYIKRTEAVSVLSALLSRRLLSENGGQYSYAPQSTELAEAVDLLAECYRTHLIALTNLIHTKASSAVQKFADVFRLRKDQ